MIFPVCHLTRFPVESSPIISAACICVLLPCTTFAPVSLEHLTSWYRSRRFRHFQTSSCQSHVSELWQVLPGSAVPPVTRQGQIKCKQRTYHKVRWRSPGWFVSAAGPSWACVERSEPSSKGGLHGNNPCDILTVVIFMEIEPGCRNVYAGSWVFSRRSSLRYRRKALLSTAHHLGNPSYSRVISPGSGVVQM